ncbi:SIS domain-containing protein [Bacillus solitudinis]|uniref:SIS domain-containing protein n=1 Tax=Bacillus solitudinis TaxID=2014074 RepID=UPI000C23080F|nr:SIS domain-containing protein [Bacillus solitudinis]
MKNIMWDYINEETDKLMDLLDHNQIDQFLKAYDTTTISKVIFVASGSSLNIATVAKRFYEDVAQIEIRTYTPFEFLGHSKIVESFDRAATLVVAISQTGTSSGTVQSIERAKELGFTVLSMTERKETQVEQLGDYYFNFLSGLESCNAKTKGVSNSLTLLIVLAISVGKEKGLISEELFKAYIDEITASINDITATIKATKKWTENHQDWSTINQFLVVGHGTNYGSAVEGALKILETLCVPGSVCEIGEFSHGVHRTMTNASNVMLIQTEEYGQEVMEKTIDFLSGTVGRLLVVNATSEPVQDERYINVAYRPLTASCLNITVAFQVLATALPEINGDDPNRPMNNDLTKIVNTRV